MNKHPSSKSMAHTLNLILDKVYGDSPNRFPVDVAKVALEYSAQIFPEDPIVYVQGADLPDFDGALKRSPRKNAWGIIFNNSVSSQGRIRFTLAHELGHYLLHRTKYPKGLPCSQWDSLSSQLEELNSVEREADEFASYLLMPKNDFCKRISQYKTPTFTLLLTCAEFYGVSLTAAVVHWVNLTKLRAVIVISREGYILWSRSSASAMKTGTYIKTVDSPPIPLHKKSLPAQEFWSYDDLVAHDSGIWFDESCEEIAVFSRQHDFAISILILEPERAIRELEEETIEDGYDYLQKTIQGSDY